MTTSEIALLILFLRAGASKRLVYQELLALL